MKRDAETLRIVGLALFGPAWQSPLARELDVAVRTMQRWAAGEHHMPSRMWDELAVVCKRRGEALGRLAKMLGTQTPAKPRTPPAPARGNAQTILGGASG